jgi:uncharacterized damage-inducible protein DinB
MQMSEMKHLAGQLNWAAKNLAYNLDFIPDDKLSWKPAPTANSALEIVGHLLGMYGHFSKMLGDAAGESGEAQTPTSRDEAKIKLVAAAEEYSYKLMALSPDDMAREVEFPFGKFKLGFAAAMPVTDTIHHHGQIAYIQSLLGDEESHFDFSLLPS